MIVVAQRCQRNMFQSVYLRIRRVLVHMHECVHAFREPTIDIDVDEMTYGTHVRS